MKRFARGDLGESLAMDRPIGPFVAEAFRNSLALAVPSILSVSVIGIGTGIVGALRHRRAADYLTSIAAFAGISLPEFFWGIVPSCCSPGTSRSCLPRGSATPTTTG